MLHEVKYKVERSLVLPEVDSFLFVSNDLSELDDVFVFQLSQDLNFSHSRDWKSL